MSTKELTVGLLDTLNDNQIQLVFNFVCFLKSEYGEVPNAETLEAMAEVEEMKKTPSLYKGYTDIDEMMKEILN